MTRTDDVTDWHQAGSEPKRRPGAAKVVMVGIGNEHRHGHGWDDRRRCHHGQTPARRHLSRPVPDGGCGTLATPGSVRHNGRRRRTFDSA